jgi:hypothetical protein
MDDIYNFLALLDANALLDGEIRSRALPPDRRIIRLCAIQAKLPELRVSRVEHASPGILDFLGAHKVLKQINDFYFGNLDRFLERNKRKIEHEKSIAELQHYKTDQQLAEEDRKLDREYKNKVRYLALEEKQIANRKALAEAEREEVSLLADQVKLSRSIESSFARNELDGHEQMQAVKWLDSRYRPIGQLIADGKITATEDRELDKDSD